MNDKKITEDTIGGSIDLPLAKAILPDGSAIEALYFIIHDTSTPNLVDAEFLPTSIRIQRRAATT
ncbi:MAG: hypothetical protein IPK58_21165 [Acidobacteria bacterium]|nr:hypothetical protein [Acidobacteriota bacterium]